jgi:hypothetical protein
MKPPPMPLIIAAALFFYCLYLRFSRRWRRVVAFAFGAPS